MKEEWNELMELKGKRLIGLEVKRIIIHKNEDSFSFYCFNPFIHWKLENSTEEGFWRLKWTENEEGEDVLLLNKQDTPEPLEYNTVKADELNAKYIVQESSITHSGKIQNVIGIGFTTKGNDYLSAIVLEFGNSYIQIEVTPALFEVTIYDHFPIMKNNDKVMFSTRQ